MQKRSSRKSVLFPCVVLILVIVMLISGLQILESTVFHQGMAPTSASKKTIERDGVQYFPRQDITVVMILGIDQMGKVEPTNSYNNPGASDMVALMIFDEKKQESRVLCLNRDTMLDMPILGIGGKIAGTAYQQLALSHTYGTGMEDSCENTKKTVSDFLYGLKIDYYVSLNMDAIAILNDAVGGVTVTVEDDFSNVDPTIGKGEVTLYGHQAVSFVRGRGGVGDELNVSRMERQKEYIDGFMKAFLGKREEGITFLLEAYEKATPYMVTDCSMTVMQDITQRYANYPIVEILSPEGVNRKGETYMEYYVDENKLDELILRLFYAPKD